MGQKELVHRQACETNTRVISIEVTWLWAPTQQTIFLAQFKKIRLSFESLESLTGFQAYLEPKL